MLHVAAEPFEDGQFYCVHEVDDPENDSMEDIPVIHLENSHLEGNGTTAVVVDAATEELLDAIVEEGNHGHPAAATITPTIIPQAAPIVSSIHTREEDVESGYRDDDDLSASGIMIRERAELISVLVLVPQPPPLRAENGSTTATFGLQFFPPGEIGQIEDTSILSHSPLRPGDELVSLNGKATEKTSQEDMAALILRMIRRSKKYVHLVFRNPMQDATTGLIQCMLMKKRPNDSLGISVEICREETIRIAHIDPNGIGGQSSLLNVGDTLLEVNGVTCNSSISLQDVIHLLQSAPKYVNLTVRAGSAVVVSEVARRTRNETSPRQEQCVVNRTGVACNNHIHPSNHNGRLHYEERGLVWSIIIKTCLPSLLILVPITALILASKNRNSYNEY